MRRRHCRYRQMQMRRTMQQNHAALLQQVAARNRTPRFDLSDEAVPSGG